MRIEGHDVGSIWFRLLETLVRTPSHVSPRGIGCRERVGVTLYCDNSQRNVLLDPVRRPNYRFMVAEWLWIWFGHEDVATIARYNPKIAAFSDNGDTFNGAYGPPVRAQWSRARDLIINDNDTRQSVLIVYRIPAGPTKDVPCTLTLQFLLRSGVLHTVASMRSSDIWLGLCYDWFNFTQLANVMAADLRANGVKAAPGTFTIHLGSSHLYDTNLDQAREVLAANVTNSAYSSLLPSTPPSLLDGILTNGEELIAASQPWKTYANALSAKTSVEALHALLELSK